MIVPVIDAHSRRYAGWDMKWRDIQAGLDMLPDDATRREVMAAARRSASGIGSAFRRLLFPGLIAGAFMFAAQCAATAFGQGPISAESRVFELLGLISLLVGFSVGGYVANQLDQRPLSIGVVCQLFMRGIIVCSRCGYARRRESRSDLGRCSECGNEGL